MLELSDINRRYKGDVDGFIRGSEKMAEQGGLAIHTIQPAEIVVHGSKACAQSVGTISTRFRQNDAEYDLVSHCRLLSRLQQTSTTEGALGPWKMLSIEMIYVQDNIFPVVPPALSQDPGFSKSIAGRRKSYQLLTWVMEQRGYTINDELPGIDRPESARNLLGRNEEWVFS
jgi:hypothetical protein